jgi:hypothetical protein
MKELQHSSGGVPFLGSLVWFHNKMHSLLQSSKSAVTHQPQTQLQQGNQMSMHQQLQSASRPTGLLVLGPPPLKSEVTVGALVFATIMVGVFLFLAAWLGLTIRNYRRMRYQVFERPIHGQEWITSRTKDYRIALEAPRPIPGQRKNQ